MFAKIEITGLDGAETGARAILEHVEAIKRLQRETTWQNIEVHATIGTEPSAATDGSTTD